MKRTLILSSALLVVLLTGCQAISEKKAQIDAREETITNVVGQVWRLDAKWPGEFQANQQLTEHVYKKARRHCEDQGLTFLPIKGTSTDGAEDGSTAATVWLEFRCQRPLNYRPEYKGITKTVNPDELTDIFNTEN